MATNRQRAIAAARVLRHVHDVYGPEAALGDSLMRERLARALRLDAATADLLEAVADIDVERALAAAGRLAGVVLGDEEVPA